MKYLSLLGLGIALALPALGQTENVPFTILAQSQSGSGPDTAQQLEIRSPQGMSAVDTWLSTPAPFVDWGNEVVVLVSLGTKPSGGYAVEVTGVTRTRLTTGPSGYRYEVQVREQAPSGPAISIPTQPYQIVKFRARPNDPIVFVGQPTLPPPPPMATYDRVRFAQSTPATAGPPQQRTLTVTRNGDVEVTLSLGVPVSLSGRATPQELVSVERLVRQARMGTVPNPLQVTTILPAAIENWSLRVESIDPSLGGNTRGAQLGNYGTFDARLRPLISRLIAIADRVANATSPTAGVHSGELRVRGPRVSLRLATGEELRVQPEATARGLRGLDRRFAELEGTLSAPPGGPRVLTVARVLSPRRERALRGTVQFDADGQPTLSVGSGLELQVVGPLRDLVRSAASKTVTVDAWVLGQVSNPTGAQVEAVQASARVTTSVYSRYRWVGRLYPGSTVWVEGTSSTLSYARIRRGPTRAGWVRRTALEVGDSIPTPTATPGTTPGLTGSIPK